MSLQEFTTKYKSNEKVVFEHNYSAYKGEIITTSMNKNDEITYTILSGDIVFKKQEVDILESLDEADLQEFFEWVTGGEIHEPEIEEDHSFFTTNDAEFSIFPDDENPEQIHIEIKPDYVWNKDDVWELIAELLYAVNEMDEDGHLVKTKANITPKKLLVLT